MLITANSTVAVAIAFEVKACCTSTMENDTRSRDSQSELHGSIRNRDDTFQRCTVIFRHDMDDAEGYNHDVHSGGGGNWDTFIRRLHGFHWNHGNNAATTVTDVHGVRYDCQPFDHGKN